MNVPLPELLCDPWTQRLGWALIHFLWQGTAAALLLAFVLYLLRRRSPKARWAACCVALCVMAAMPPVTGALVPVDPPAPATPVTTALAATPAPVMPADPEPAISLEPAPTVRSEPVSAANVGAATSAPWHRRVGAWIEPLLPWAVLAWLVGVLSLALWHLGGWWSLRRAKYRGVRPAGKSVQELFGRLAERLSVSRPVRLFESARMAVPVVVGWLRPAVLLPAGALCGLTPDQLEAVLAHELAHVRRHDALVRALQAVVETLLFYHPAVWWVSGRIRQASEECCDEVALDVCGDRRGYARALSLVAEMGREPKRATAAGGGRLVRRVRRILGLEPQRPALAARWLAGVLAVAVAACIAAGAYFGAAPSAAAEEAAETVPTPAETHERAEQFRSKLPSGATVELAGVSYHPSEGKQWWRPDGTVLEDRDWRTQHTRPHSREADPENCRQIVVRTHGPRHAQTKLVTWKFDGEPGARAGLNVYRADRRLEDWTGLVELFGADQRTAEMSFAIASGPWRTVTIGPGSEDTEYGTFVIGKPFSHEGEAAVTVSSTSAVPGFSKATVAISRSGREYVGRTVEGYHHRGLAQVVRVFEGIRPEQIRNLELRVRPYTWVTFENVSLEPGHRTQVEVTAEEDVSPEAQELRSLVEDFFAHNYRDITSRGTIEWGEPKLHEDGNRSIRYKYRATIWGRDQIVQNKVFTFGGDGEFVRVQDVGQPAPGPEPGGPAELPIRTYEVNKSVADFPEGEDLSTPEAAYATLNRLAASGERAFWQHLSVERVAERMPAGGHGQMEDEFKQALLNARILQVQTCADELAGVLARLPGETVRNPIDFRRLELEDGRWLNAGNSRFDTVEEARAHFARTVPGRKPGGGPPGEPPTEPEGTALELRLRLIDARAEMRTAEAERAAAEEELKRAEWLFEQGNVNEAEVRRARLAHRKAVAQFEAAARKAQLLSDALDRRPRTMVKLSCRAFVLDVRSGSGDAIPRDDLAARLLGPGRGFEQRSTEVLAGGEITTSEGVSLIRERAIWQAAPDDLVNAGSTAPMGELAGLTVRPLPSEDRRHVFVKVSLDVPGEQTFTRTVGVPDGKSMTLLVYGERAARLAERWMEGSPPPTGAGPVAVLLAVRPQVVILPEEVRPEPSSRNRGAGRGGGVAGAGVVQEQIAAAMMAEGTEPTGGPVIAIQMKLLRVTGDGKEETLSAPSLMLRDGQTGQVDTTTVRDYILSQGTPDQPEPEVAQAETGASWRVTPRIQESAPRTIALTISSRSSDLAGRLEGEGLAEVPVVGSREWQATVLLKDREPKTIEILPEGDSGTHYRLWLHAQIVHPADREGEQPEPASDAALRREARKTVLKQRLHGLGLAINTYRMAHDGEYPPGLELLEEQGYLGEDNPLESFSPFGREVQYVIPDSGDPGEALLYHWPPFAGGTWLLYQDHSLDWVEIEDGRLVNPRTDELIRGAQKERPEGVSFGPVIERVVSDDSQETDMFIDLDRGLLLTLPEDLDPHDSDALMRWIRNSGVDALCETSVSVRGLVCFDMVVRPTSEAIWERGSAEHVSSRELLATGTPGSPVFMTAKGELPVTYMFRTSEGGTGILQIVGFTEEPKGVRIRYRLVKGTARGPREGVGPHDLQSGLHEAAAAGDAGAIQQLVAGSADVNALDDQGKTPLHVAAESGSVEACRALLDAGAELEPREKREFTPLAVAAFKDRPETVEFLLERGADVNAKNVWIWTPLHCAAQIGATEVARILYEHGADPTVESNRHETPLDLALSRGHAGIVALLTPDTHETRAAEEEWGDIGKVLIAQGAGRLRPMQVRVLSEETGEPIPGATVSFRIDGPRGEGQTDEEGTCRIPIPDGELNYLLVTASSKGLASRRMYWRRTDERELPERCTLRLKPAVAIGGVVRNARGEPVGDARVNVHTSSSGPGPQDFFTRENLPTDEQGRWKAKGAPADARRFSIHVSHPDYAAEPHYHWVQMEELRSMDYVSVLERGCALRGRVTDAEGSPVPDARVMLGTDRFGLPRELSTTTDEQGRFALESVSPTVQTVTVYARGYAPDMRTVKVGPETEPLTFRLDQGHTIRGRVTGPDGTPLEDAAVVADTWRDCRPNFWETRTDAEGRFAWNSAPADAVLFVVYKQGYMSRRNLSLTAREEEYVIRMQRPLEVRGTVTDAETGEPIPEFTVIPGIQWDAQRATSWQREDAKPGTEGRYRVEFTYPRFGHAVRVEAEGYRPAVSRTFKDDEGRVTCDFALEKGAGIQGVVLRPDGRPADGARCALVRAGQSIRVENGAIARQPESPVVETDVDGRLRFPAEVGEFAILVLHRSGYALVPGRELPADGRILLSSWGRVEGRAMRGDAPFPGAEVKVFARDGSPGSTSPYISWQYSTRADGEGRFTFSQVREGEVQALLAVEKEHGRSTYTHHELAFVESGETVKVTLGGGGRPVVGRIGLPEDAGFALEAVDARARLSPSRPELPLPEGFDEWPEDKQREWHEEWQNSEEGRAFRREHYGSYYVALRPDGSFRAEDVPPGDYTLWITLQQPTRPGRRLEALAQAKEAFVLDEGSGPRDLGTVEAVVLTHLQSGERAPDVSFETLEGERMELSDLRGRYVLLDFWATWCGPCLGETPYLVEVWEQFGGREDFAMVGLSLDRGKDRPRAYAEENGMEWVQGFLGDWSSTSVPDRFGVRGIPSIFLIDPEGRIVARDLRGQRIEGAVEAALPPRK